MAKSRTRFVCQECGAVAIKWQGKCSDCGNWNTYVEETGPFIVEHAISHSEPERLQEIRGDPDSKTCTHIQEFDRVTGGGLVQGSILLIGGPPGIGKSTLLLQIAQSVAEKSGPVLYVTGEESSQQVKIRSIRLHVDSEKIFVLPEICIESIITCVEKMKPALVLIDSIQTLHKSDFSGAPGSVTQIRECTASLVRAGKSLGTTIIIVGHVTKDGAIAGPRVLEHMVDTVLYFEGEDTGIFRILKSVKNRFGSTNEVGVFQMSQNGLSSLENPSSFFLAHRGSETPGSVIVPVIEGTRPILVEIQALVAETHGNTFPCRKVKGINHNRLALLLAVLEKRASLSFGNSDVYVNVVGGMEIDEPAVDLAIAIAIASAKTNRLPIEGCVAFGEIGLGGEIRPVQFTLKRIQEAERLGFKTCVFPSSRFEGEEGYKPSIDLLPVSNIRDTIDKVLDERKKTSSKQEMYSTH